MYLQYRATQQYIHNTRGSAGRTPGYARGSRVMMGKARRDGRRLVSWAYWQCVFQVILE